MQCDLDWGIGGVETALARGDILVIVDTLSFSTAVVAALERGARVLPCADRERAVGLAQELGAELAGSRTEEGLSLSPLSYENVTSGTRIVLGSPNGGACAEMAMGAEYAFIGSLRNAQSLAEHVALLASQVDRDITLIAAGERSHHFDLPGDTRLLFAIEDYLTCGAILSAIMMEYTAEAAVCVNAFLASQGDIDPLLRESMSARRLIAQGYEADVAYALQRNASTCVPQLRDGWIVPHDLSEMAVQETLPADRIREARSAGDALVASPESPPILEEEESMIPFEPTTEGWPEALIELRDRALQCTQCALSETRTHVVFGEGNPASRLMLIGEGPGDQEDRTGRPFVGRAGQLLDEALRQVGIDRTQLWIANVLKCRACVIENGRAKNRPPRADEIRACRPWLEAQIEIIQPTVILCLGAPAANLIIHKNFKMTQERGEWFTDSPFAPYAIAALHPAYILRQHGEAYASAFESLITDIKAAFERAQEEPPKKQQLTLF